MDKETKNKLSQYAVQIRMGIVDSVYKAQSGHPGGSLSAADLLAYLYFNEMRVNPENPQSEERDRFVLSKGHCTPALYTALALKGFFPVSDIPSFRRIDSYLQGHPNMNTVPGVDMSTGSLGQGVSAAAGMAKAAKYIGKNDINVYTLLGDGEIEEGQVWEAFMFAAHYNLDNLCVIIDCNSLQIDGACKDVMNAQPVDEKLASFGFETVTIDGNDFDELEKAFNLFHKSDKPFAIIMKTIKGKGVSYMENQVDWHGKAPNKELYEQAMSELEEKQKELRRVR